MSFSSMASPRALGVVKMSPTYGSNVNSEKEKTGSFWASRGMPDSVPFWLKVARVAVTNRPTDTVVLNTSRKKVRRGIVIFSFRLLGCYGWTANAASDGPHDMTAPSLY